MGDDLASKYIIRRKQKSLSFIHSKGRMQFFRDTLMGQQREKNELKINYHIQEWNTFTTTYVIFQNHSTYPTVWLLLDTAHQTDYFIIIWGKWIFDSNLEFTLPLTSAWLNYICCVNDTDEITRFGVLHAIRAVPPVVSQKILNFLFFWSGLQCPKAYSLWGGVVPSPSIG